MSGTHTSVLSKGTKLYIGQDAPISSPEVFTQVGGITDVGAPESSSTEIDDTDLDSEAKEFIRGLVDYGSITMQLKYRSTDPVVQRIEDLGLSGDNVNWRIVYANGTKKEFNAFVKSFNPSAAVDSIVKGPLTLRINGVVTTTYPS